jgi:predicted site-specific integrase-resolvase
VYTLKEAAEAVGMTKPAISKSIKRGSISATKDERGQWIIDPSELYRVYQPVNKKHQVGSSCLQEETTVNANILQLELEILRQERERERKQHEETINDLRHRLDQSETERRETQGKLTALLTHQPGQKIVPVTQVEPEPSINKGGLWNKLFGKRS